MATQSTPNGIVFFGYPFSPYAARVKAYLALRNIHYAECIQPPILPRPDLNALGVRYRRIPVMAVGRDIYVDTRAIITRLEELFPASAEHPPLSSPESQGLALLLNNFVGNTGGVFSKAVTLMNPEQGLAKDPAFQKDRSELIGAGFFKGGWVEARKEGLVHLRQAFGVIESLLQDGRQWLAATKDVSIADTEAEFIFDFALRDLRAPKEYFNEKEYPKTLAWKTRYREVLDAAMKRASKPVPVKGDEALKRVTEAGFSDSRLVVEANDPLHLSENAVVDVFPTDGGGQHRDRGRLVKLTRDEVAIEVKASNGEAVRIHAPRWNFRVKAVEDKGKL